MKRDVYLLGLTSFFNDLASEGIYALLPLVLRDTALLGLIGGLFNGLAYAVKPISGLLSDRLGRAKPFVIAGYVLSSLAKLAIALSEGIALVIAVLLDRIGKGIRDAPRDRLLAEEERRGWAFSIHRALDTLGALVGTAVAFILINFLVPRTAIFLLALTSFLAIIPLILVRERPQRGSKETGTVKLDGLIVLTVLIGGGLIAPMLFISRAEEVVGKAALLLYMLFNLAYVTGAFLASRWSERMGKERVMELGLVAGMAALLLIPLPHPLLMAIAFLLYGLAFGTVLPMVFAKVGDRTRSSTAMGLFHAAFGLSVLFSSFVAGVAVKIVGYSALSLFALPLLMALLLSYTV